jgi:uncharacterized UPF0160 family protein
MMITIHNNIFVFAKIEGFTDFVNYFSFYNYRFNDFTNEEKFKDVSAIHDLLLERVRLNFMAWFSTVKGLQVID